MTREQRREVLIRPLRIWALLMVLLGATFAYAYLPAAPVKTFVSLSIGVVKALFVVLLFMQLKKAAGLVRMAAVIGLTWASFLYLFALADYFTR
jgi:cytochrome c oxidase subunit IV